MRVAIAGAGGIAFSYAAFLSDRGHEPMIWSPSGGRGQALAEGAPLTARGALEGRWPVAVAPSAERLCESAEVVILAVPAYGYLPVLEAVLPFLRQGQTVIFSAHLSFAALWLSRRLAERGIHCPLAVWNTTASTGRQPSETEVSISQLRRQVEMSVVPACDGAAVLELCTTLFGERFALREALLGVELGNLNPMVHYAIAMFNITRMEKAETWAQQAHMTPAVCRFMEAIDAERLAIAAAFGVQSRSIHDSYAIPGKVERGPLAEMVEKIVQLRPGVNGPKSADTRYVTEDVPYGLVSTLRLAQLCGIEAPLHAAGLRIFSALYGRDFAAENRILPEISEAFASINTLEAALAGGWPALFAAPS